MADTTFISKSFATPIAAAWLQDINNFFYRGQGIVPQINTPIVNSGSAVNLNFQINSVNAWSILVGTNAFVPAIDNTQSAGSSTNRLSTVFTPILDSGVPSTLSLKTNNGTTQLAIDHIASAVNIWRISGGATGNKALLTIGGGGDSSAAGIIRGAKNGASLDFTSVTDNGIQLSIISTAGATNHITIAGSNGGNPTISTSAGSLAITPNTLIAGGVSLGANPLFTFSGVNLSYADGIVSNSSVSGTALSVAGLQTINSVTNVLCLGALIQGNSAGAVIRARSGAGVPAVGDIPNGDWALWRDTAGATTKLYYNNGGSLQSVALV